MHCIIFYKAGLTLNIPKCLFPGTTQRNSRIIRSNILPIGSALESFVTHEMKSRSRGENLARFATTILLRAVVRETATDRFWAFRFVVCDSWNAGVFDTNDDKQQRFYIFLPLFARHRHYKHWKKIPFTDVMWAVSWDYNIIGQCAYTRYLWLLSRLSM